MQLPGLTAEVFIEQFEEPQRSLLLTLRTIVLSELNRAPHASERVQIGWSALSFFLPAPPKGKPRIVCSVHTCKRGAKLAVCHWAMPEDPKGLLTEKSKTMSAAYFSTAREVPRNDIRALVRSSVRAAQAALADE
jgi:hypothetical protein